MERRVLAFAAALKESPGSWSRFLQRFAWLTETRAADRIGRKVERLYAELLITPCLAEISGLPFWAK